MPSQAFGHCLWQRRHQSTSGLDHEFRGVLLGFCEECRRCEPFVAAKTHSRQRYYRICPCKVNATLTSTFEWADHYSILYSKCACIACFRSSPSLPSVLFRYFLQLEEKRCGFISAVVSRQAKVGGHADMNDSVLALQRVTSSVLVCLKRKFF